MVNNFEKWKDEIIDGKWDDEVNDDWDGKIPRWIKNGRNLKWLYEDLIAVAEEISECEGVEVNVMNHGYEDGKIPMLYLGFEKSVSRGSKKRKLEKELIKKRLVRNDEVRKKDTPYSGRVDVIVSCFSYDVEDYGVV